MFDRGPRQRQFQRGRQFHTGHRDPADPNSKPAVSVFDNLTTYKNRNGGVWGRGEMHLFRNLKFADNAIGFTHAAGAGPRPNTPHGCSTRCSSAKPTTSATPAPRGEGLRPQHAEAHDAGFPIRGYEYYDYRHDVVNTTFRNYQDNATRKTGAISHLLYTSFGASYQQCRREREVRQRQAGVLPADGAQVGQRQ